MQNEARSNIKQWQQQSRNAANLILIEHNQDHSGNKAGAVWFPRPGPAVGRGPWAGGGGGERDRSIRERPPCFLSRPRAGGDHTFRGKLRRVVN